MSQPTDDNVAVLTWACPSIPEALNDRAADNWEPLLAIADLAGSAKRDSRKVTFIVRSRCWRRDAAGWDLRLQLPRLLRTHAHLSIDLCVVSRALAISISAIMEVIIRVTSNV
jgi:hypothetical protein